MKLHLIALLSLAAPLILCACSKQDDAPAEPAAEAAAPEAEAPTAAEAPAGEAPADEAAAPTDEAAAEAPPPLEMAGDKYGNGVTLAKAISVSELFARADELDGQRVRIEGQVLEVCKKKGCWMNVAGDQPGTHLRIKVQDDAIVFPISAEGRYAVAEGLVKKMPLSLEETRAHLAHEAEEQGREFDPASVTQAITMIRVDGLGAMIRDSR
jgi:hypothetical protein